MPKGIIFLLLDFKYKTDSSKCSGKLSSGNIELWNISKTVIEFFLQSRYFSYHFTATQPFAILCSFVGWDRYIWCIGKSIATYIWSDARINKGSTFMLQEL